MSRAPSSGLDGPLQSLPMEGGGRGGVFSAQEIFRRVTHSTARQGSGDSPASGFILSTLADVKSAACDILLYCWRGRAACVGAHLDTMSPTSPDDIVAARCRSPRRDF